MRDARLRAAAKKRREEEKLEAERVRERVRNMTPAQREKEGRKLRQAQFAERELKRASGERLGGAATAACA